MVFYPPKSFPNLSHEPPDSVPISEFMLNETWGRAPLAYSRDPYTCGLTGTTYSALEQKERVEHLAKALSKELGWTPNEGTEWDKVVGLFSLNTIDFVTLCWATHRLSGIVSPGNASYSAAELEHQLKDSGAKVLFTCAPLFPIALEAATNVGIAKNKIFLLDMPKIGNEQIPEGLKTVNQLIETGKSLPRIEGLKWSKGQGARQIAFLCYSSGTSGLPKGVMISHKNVIANILQIKQLEVSWREKKRAPGTESDYNETNLGLLPLSHIYGLVVIAHSSVYRGDQVIILPKFEIKSFLRAIAKFKINCLFVVPPIIISMLENKDLCKKYDLSSVDTTFTGAAPLGAEIATELQRQYPQVTIRQGYGLTESSTVLSSTPPDDVFFGSSGVLLPNVEAKVVSTEGVEITGYDQPGELLVRSPSITLGYLHNVAATKETFVDGWLHTGDEVVFRKSPSGSEHLFIVDRIKELIKVKGLQVAPAELEAHILTSDLVADCAVIPVPDPSAGEVPKAYVVKSRNVGGEVSDAFVKRKIAKHVQDHKARHKWLKGGVEFIDVIPKSPSGKILRRLLRDADREKKRKLGSKL